MRGKSGTERCYSVGNFRCCEEQVWGKTVYGARSEGGNEDEFVENHVLHFFFLYVFEDWVIFEGCEDSLRRNRIYLDKLDCNRMILFTFFFSPV